MSARKRFWLPHLFTWVACLVLIPSLVMLFCLALVLATGDPGGPANAIFIPSINCGVTALLCLVLLPLTAGLERVLETARPQWRSRLLSPWLAGTLFGINTLLVTVAWAWFIWFTASGRLASLPETSAPVPSLGFLFLAATPLSLGGTLYWLLLRLISPRLGTQEG